MEDPGTVMRRAFEALAADDFNGILDRLDERELARVVELRRDLTSRMGKTGQPQASTHMQRLLSSWGLDSLDEFDALPSREVLRRGLAASAGRLRTIRCEVDEWELQAEDRATVTFRVVWMDSPAARMPDATAELRRPAAGWRVRSLQLNWWLLPGLENLMVSEQG